jgi:hypothetical protein
VWLAFLLPLPLAVLAVRRVPLTEDVRRRAMTVFALYCLMLVVALAGAGFWFVSESLVQLNLYRFSIYPKLLSCVALAWLLWDADRRRRPYTVGALVLVAVGAAAVAASTGLLAPPTLQSPLGLKLAGLQGDDADYVALADWARDNTPKDAVFLVPPDEESFRVRARRAIVVNYKGVPQLSGELPEWRDRLEDVLDLDTAGLLALPRPMGRTLQAIRARYDALPPEHHVAVARRWGARYLIVTHRMDLPGARLVSPDSNGHYYLYDLSAQ